MPQTQVKQVRKQSVECARLVASFFVVFVHCPFPGRFGKAVICIARFAVPMFLMISGYFSYRVDSRKMAVRVRKMLWLNVIATLVYVLKRYLVESHFNWGLMETILELAPGKRQILMWVVLGLNPYSEHLWYLVAACLCNAVMWGYAVFWEEREICYRPFYGFCAVLLMMQFVVGEMLSLLGVSVPYVLCRNPILPGLPLFGLGLFLREYQERIIVHFRLTDAKLLFLILGGICCSLFRYAAAGEVEVPLGMVVAAAALLLLLTEHPSVLHGKTADACISKFGFLSAAMYILHQFVYIFYGRLAQPWMESVFGGNEPWLRPILVILVTLAVSVPCERLHARKPASR